MNEYQSGFVAGHTSGFTAGYIAGRKAAEEEQGKNQKTPMPPVDPRGGMDYEGPYGYGSQER